MDITWMNASDIVEVPQDEITADVISRFISEFNHCGTGLQGTWNPRSDWVQFKRWWKNKELHMIGLVETQKVFDVLREEQNYDWTMNAFAKPGAPYSIFFAVFIPYIGHWISPSMPPEVKALVERRIKELSDIWWV